MKSFLEHLWKTNKYAVVAQLVARDIWDVEVACSNHVAPTAFSECANSNPVRLMETGMFSFLVPDYQRFRRVSYGQP
mgnify:CR=1 FL=1